MAGCRVSVEPTVTEIENLIEGLMTGKCKWNKRAKHLLDQGLIMPVRSSDGTVQGYRAGRV